VPLFTALDLAVIPIRNPYLPDAHKIHHPPAKTILPYQTLFTEPQVTRLTSQIIPSFVYPKRNL
jgi:hypothetical protein